MHYPPHVTFVKYDYIHLLSGQDLPIKSQDDICAFLESLKPGTNLIGFATSSHSLIDMRNKFYYHIPLYKLKRSRSILMRGLERIIDGVLIKMQKYFGIARKWGDIKPYKGSQWISITFDFCEYVVEHKDMILEKFKNVKAADEMFLQTIIMNSNYASTIYDLSDEFHSCMRAIDWNRGKPYIWRIEDFDNLKSCNALFARKFSIDVDHEIIYMLSNEVNKKGL